MTMERNNSPSNGNNRHKNVKTKTIKSSCYFSSITTPARSKHRKLEVQDNLNCQDRRIKTSDVSVPHYTNNFSRRQGSPKLKPTSPSKERSPRTSPTLGIFYAGAKFSEPPPPAALPKPPMHWASRIYSTNGGPFSIITSDRADKSRDISNQLKLLLNVSAWLTLLKSHLVDSSSAKDLWTVF